MELIKTRNYLKSMKNIPKKDKDAIEARVDRLETDLTGVLKIEGTKNQARLEVGEYRVFLTKQGGKVVALIVEEAVRHTTTTYRKKK